MRIRRRSIISNNAGGGAAIVVPHELWRMSAVHAWSIDATLGLFFWMLTTACSDPQYAWASSKTPLYNLRLHFVPRESCQLVERLSLAHSNVHQVFLALPKLL